MCTRDPEVVNFWNNLDKQIELEMDVLDDFEGECKEVFKFNSWLTYGEPFHRLREFGISIKEFDLIDESLLGKEQMKVILSYL